MCDKETKASEHDARSSGKDCERETSVTEAPQSECLANELPNRLYVDAFNGVVSRRAVLKVSMFYILTDMTLQLVGRRESIPDA